MIGMEAFTSSANYEFNFFFYVWPLAGYFYFSLF